MNLIRKFEFMGQNIVQESKKRPASPGQIVAHDAHPAANPNLSHAQKNSMLRVTKNTPEPTQPNDLVILGMSLAVLGAVALMVFLIVFGV